MALPSDSIVLSEEWLHGPGSAAQLLTKSLTQAEVRYSCEPAVHCKNILKYEAK